MYRRERRPFAESAAEDLGGAFVVCSDYGAGGNRRLSLPEGIIRPSKTRIQLERNFLESRQSMKQSMGLMGNQSSSKSLLWFLRFAEAVLFTVGVLKWIGLRQEIKFFTFPDPLLSFLNN